MALRAVSWHSYLFVASSPNTTWKSMFEVIVPVDLLPQNSLNFTVDIFVRKRFWCQPV